MRRRNLFLVVLFLAIGLLIFSGQHGINSASAIELRFAHFAADGHPGDLAAEMFAKAVEQRTGGKVKVTVYPANELGSPPSSWNRSNSVPSIWDYPPRVRWINTQSGSAW